MPESIRFRESGQFHAVKQHVAAAESAQTLKAEVHNQQGDAGAGHEELSKWMNRIVEVLAGKTRWNKAAQ